MSLVTNGGRVVTAAALILLLALVPAPVPAHAHGAVQTPISRVLACGPDGGERSRSAACVAALAAGVRVGEWDNIRMANVDGRDREVIRDGHICSGGLDRYRGLDLARADWPATTLSPGAAYTFSYKASIPHQGTFRMYVTTAAYDPAKPLRWSDVETQPFLSATNPSFSAGAYTMKGKLPTGRSGRHVIVTIWQNSSTPDTYYSCSDVLFPAAVSTASDVPRLSTVEAKAPAAAGSPEKGASPIALGAFAVAAFAVGVSGVLFWRRRRTRIDS
jgi:predicted carbohydrate-binding protein with CBM5 and CBM33 domain